MKSVTYNQVDALSVLYRYVCWLCCPIYWYMCVTIFSYRTLLWVKLSAPIIIHVHLDRVLGFLVKDTHYRNLFETLTGSGSTDQHARASWEVCPVQQNNQSNCLLFRTGSSTMCTMTVHQLSESNMAYLTSVSIHSNRSMLVDRCLYVNGPVKMD